MTEKRFKKAYPFATLRTQIGKEYWLMKNDVLNKDSWMQDRQQLFLVVPKGVWDVQDGVEYYSYPRPLLTTDPDIEILYDNKPILVMDLYAEDIMDEELVEPYFPEVNLEKLDEFISSVEQSDD